jgi:hypothetical protein
MSPFANPESSLREKNLLLAAAEGRALFSVVKSSYASAQENTEPGHQE